MRRVARRLFAMCSAASLLLCVAGCVLWARSMRAEESIGVCAYEFRPDHELQTTWSLNWSRGVVRLGGTIAYCAPGTAKGTAPVWRYGWGPARYAPFSGTLSLNPLRDRRTALQKAGFELYHLSSGSPPFIKRGLILPIWFVAGLFAIAPAAWMQRRRSARVLAARLGRGQCRRCGYDLRATPGRCPECGTAAPAPVPPGARK